MKLTLIHPAIGKYPGQKYIKSWQMEPLGVAVLAGLSPPDVEITFFDDRTEDIDYSVPADLVAISVETYTARRAYQIASLYRERGVTVILGGFHVTLVPEEASLFADSIIIGEAEGIWAQVVEDFRAGRLQARYSQRVRPALSGAAPDKSIYRGKSYLPITLIEAGRGCHLKCDFCVIQEFFSSTQTRKPFEEVIEEVKRSRNKLIFFVDDNITSNIDQAKQLFRELIPLKIRWISQSSMHAAHDREFLDLMTRSGCQGVLVGFESLDESTLRKMKKGFNLQHGGYQQALSNFREFGVRLYPTFILGYDEDTEATFERAVEFALQNRFYIAAFNHLTPFPGTPLYERLQTEDRLLFRRWWLNPGYRYGMVPFQPKRMSPESVRQNCLAARKKFYSLRSILLRSFDFKVNSNNTYMWTQFFVMNFMMRREVLQREGYPLGDVIYHGPEIAVPESLALPQVKSQNINV